MCWFGYGVATSPNSKLEKYFFSLNNIRGIKRRRMRWAWHVSWMGKDENIQEDFVEKTEEKRIFGKTRRR
jgi:hypothetical protein